jgi:cytochrome c peroxidase
MIISDGYNGTPSGFENCCEDDEGMTKWYAFSPTSTDSEVELSIYDEIGFFGVTAKEFAADLKEQAAGPIANPMEMAFTHILAVDVLRSIPQYRESFKAVYKTDEITLDEVTDAIAEFEKTLVTPNSRFDLWLKGDAEAITKTELEGYELFKSIGCVACHNGPALGGNSFQKMGLVEPYETSNPAEGVAGLTG